MSRSFFRIFIHKEIADVREVLESIPDNKRLQVIAEALCDLNDRKPKAERTQRSSCGCYDWDVTMDYRPHNERYAEKLLPTGKGRTMPRHEFAQMVNELRAVPAVQSKREKIVRILHAFNINPDKPE